MKIHTVDGRDYKLRSELTRFLLKMYAHLSDWKWEHITKVPGTYLGEEYDPILPQQYEDKGEMPHLHPAAFTHLRAHRAGNPIRIHQHFYHMASSQAANINLFLPILHHPAASAILAGIKGAPADFGTLDTGQLDNGYCLEFWGGNYRGEEGDKGPLGDKTKRSGTDADIAIAYRNKRGAPCLWLIEHKLTEEEFSTCGGFKSNGRKKMPACVCARSFSEILQNKGTCYQHARRGFKYWEITEAHQDLFPGQAKFAECPFQGGLNQLWRNQLLALALQGEGNPYKAAYFSVVRHPDNTALDASLAAYKELIGGSPAFTAFTSRDVIAAATPHADKGLKEWIAWYKDLYLL